MTSGFSLLCLLVKWAAVTAAKDSVQCSLKQENGFKNISVHGIKGLKDTC